MIARVALAALLSVSIVPATLAQPHYPSTTYQNLTVLGTLTATGNQSNSTVTATGGTAARTLADIAALTGQCYGVKADGVTNDSAALAACKTNAKTGQTLTLPPGDMKLTSFPSSGPAVIWLNPGTTFNGGVPIGGLGTDLVEGSINNSKWLRRATTTADMAPMIRNDMTVSHAGGTSGFVMVNNQTTCTVPSVNAALNDYVWCNQSILNSAASGPGQHVAVSGAAFRPANALADGLGPRSQLWGGYFEGNDQTNAASNLTGSMVGIENDIYANGDDPEGLSGHRMVLQMNIGKSNNAGLPMRAWAMLQLGNEDGVSYAGRGINIAVPWDVAGIDTSTATPIANAPALRLGTGQSIALDVAGPSGAAVGSLSSNGAHLDVSANGFGWRVVAATGAANGVQVITSATGVDPILQPYGDASRNLIIQGAGTGTVFMGSNFAATAGMIVGSPTGGFKGTGTLNVAGALYANNVVGVSCSGTPTSSFASVGGIVTHC